MLCKSSKTLSTNRVLSAKTAYFLASCAAGGLTLIYGNDYGVSTWFCAFAVMFIIVFCQTRQVKKAIVWSILYMILSIVCAVLFITVISHGHTADWIKTTLGTKDYQGWYYAGNTVHSLLQADFSLPRVIQGVLCVYYIKRIYNAHGEYKASKKYWLPLLFNATALCAAEEYRLLSGGTFVKEPNIILFFSIVYGVYSEINTKYLARTVMALSAAACLWSGFSIGVPLVKNRYKGDTMQFAALGGNDISFADDIKNTEKFLQDKRVFATYASALEADTRTFQPSGYDYIIHVLGDFARDRYMESFRRGDFDYVATVAENTTYDFSDWEVWVRSASWFFYRELYRDYEKVFSNGYQVFWQKSKKNNVLPFRVTLECEQVSNDTVKIVAHTQKGVYGTADCLIEYDEKVMKLGVFSSYVEAHDRVYDILLGQKSYRQLHLRQNKGKTRQEYIPIEIADGYGEMVLTSKPQWSTQFRVLSASCDTLFTQRILTKEERSK